MTTYTDELRRLAWGTDASFYRLIPKTVIRSENEEQVQAVLREASGKGTPVTFRAAGTSLSGQSVSDSILMVAGKNWEKCELLPSEDGTPAAFVRLQPGIRGGRVNEILKRYGRKIGPDPASIQSAMMGGIIANNASGMSCGVHANSDRTLRSARIIFADGSLLDTSDAESRARWGESHKGIVDGIAAIRDEIRSNPAMETRLREKYSIKNVTGLNLRPFIAYTDPYEIIAHLMVGSEGTLGFISEACLRTLPTGRCSASAMAYYPSLRSAAEAVAGLREVSDKAAAASPEEQYEPLVAAAEMLDPLSLRSVNDPHGEDGQTALLLMVEAEDEEALRKKTAEVTDILKSRNADIAVHFTSDPEECARYWAIRSGIFPTVGGMRPLGTTCLIEDVAFKIADMPQAVEDLSELISQHGYTDSCIYGHALEGNFHFILNQSFSSPAETKRYEDFIRSVCKLVVGKYDGSLKAEHGTGRNMAPFVPYEWGEEIFGIMKRVKALLDPKGILNPGVIFNDDPLCFIKDIKSLPVISPGPLAPQEAVEVYKALNKCIECGFCEKSCVSCGFTLSSRMRIALSRHITALEDRQQARELMKQYAYPGEETCAGDGLCSSSCPMGINVADLTHELRRISAPEGSAPYRLWDFAGNHFAGTKNGIRGVLTMAQIGRGVLGDKAMASLCRGLHKAGVPLWTPAFPGPYRAPKKEQTATGGYMDKVVYFPSCFNQMMGAGKSEKRPLVEEMLDLLHKAGYEVIFPADKDKLCCGTIWESKGMPEIAEKKVRELETALLEASENGKYPVLCDQSPCLHRMRKCIKSMHLYEPAEFIWKFLRERLDFTRDDVPVAVHQTCSTRLMGLGDTIVKLAGLCSTEVVVPQEVGCCGFAGDKGMTHPELNAYALRHLRSAVESGGASRGYSNSRTCEIGLSENSGIPYSSIVYLVNSHTKAKNQ